jgi:outer membrane protein assembly factor BamD (BamD/ComL family)
LERFNVATKYLPDVVTEQITYQHIMIAFYNKDKVTADVLAKAFNDRFPKSRYSADIRQKISML